VVAVLADATVPSACHGVTVRESSESEAAMSSHRCRYPSWSEILDPPPPDHVRAAAAGFVSGLPDGGAGGAQEFGFPDNWIYIHTPEVNVGRIQNFGPGPVHGQGRRTCLGWSTSSTEGDAPVASADDDLVAMPVGTRPVSVWVASADVVEAGFASGSQGVPVYDEDTLPTSR
jgi:UDP-galactopyranose mutase